MLCFPPVIKSNRVDTPLRGRLVTSSIHPVRDLRWLHTLGSQYNSMYLGCAGMVHPFHHHKFLAPDALLTYNQIIMYYLTRPGGPYALCGANPPRPHPSHASPWCSPWLQVGEVVEKALCHRCQSSKNSWPCHAPCNHAAS